MELSLGYCSTWELWQSRQTSAGEKSGVWLMFFSFFFHLEQLMYPLTDYCLICFSLDKASTLERVKSSWYPEITHHIPEAKLILIGTKCDLVGDRVVTRMEGEAMAKYIGAVGYFEVSSLTGEGFQELVESIGIGTNSSNLQVVSKKGCTVC